MNTIYVAGNLGADPVTRFTSSGQKVTTFTVATNSKRGENTITIWYRITVWGDRFDKMISYLKKGSSVIIIGELQKPEIWTDKEGRPQVTLEVWAEIIRFSPFGKPASQEQGAGHQAVASHGGHEGGFGEQTFNGGGGHSQHGQKQQHQPAEDEEPLPF